MPLPDPEKFTIPDLAHRWGKSVDHVLGLIKSGELKCIAPLEIVGYEARSHGRGRRPRREFVKYVKREEVYRFEKLYGIRPSAPEAFEREHQGSRFEQATKQATDNQSDLPLDKQWLNIREAANYLRKDERTIRRWIDDGKLKVSGPKGSQRRISRAELLKLRNSSPQ